MRKDRDHISRSILYYLELHPEAEGTLEDIAMWWINLANMEHSVESVSESLCEMIEDGVVRKIDHGDGITTYRLAKDAPQSETSKRKKDK